MFKKKILGMIFISLSIILSLSSFTITGAVIGNSLSNYLGFIQVIFLIVGLILMASRNRNYAQEALDSGRTIDRFSDMERIAKKMDYTLVKGYREGTRIYKKGETNPLTVIPNHRTITKGTSTSILKRLAEGESNFRRR